MNVHKIMKHKLLTLLVLMFPALVSASNGYFAHGYGTKNKGLAGAGVALASDAMIAATNPAGMVFVGDRMDIGLALFSPSPRSYSATADGINLPDGPCGGPCPFTFGGNQNAQRIESENDIFYIPHFAYNWMLNKVSSFGITVYGNGGMNTEYKGGVAQHNDGTNNAVTNPGTFGAGTAGINLEQLFIASTYARKIGDKSSWGVAAIIAYQTFEATGMGNFAGFSLSPQNVSDNGVDNASGYGLKFGIQSEIVRGFSLAASYQTEMDMSEFDKYSGLFAEKGNFDIPSTWTLGLAWKLASRSHVVFDVQQINYGDIAAIANPIAPLLTCSGSQPGCLGGSEGAGFGWTDMTIYKLGYEFAAGTNWIMRLGYSHTNQPIPDTEMVFNILAPAVIEDHATLGFTVLVSKNNEINFQYMHGFKNSITGKNTFNPSQDITLEMVQNEIEISWAKKF